MSIFVNIEFIIAVCLICFIFLFLVLRQIADKIMHKINKKLMIRNWDKNDRK